jgi:hypothetical protein
MTRGTFVNSDFMKRALLEAYATARTARTGKLANYFLLFRFLHSGKPGDQFAITLGKIAILFGTLFKRQQFAEVIFSLHTQFLLRQS